MGANPLNEAVWIWHPDGRDEANQYVEFRHAFELERADETALLYISADTDYAVWLNGEFVDAGQYDDYPSRKAYDCIPIGSRLRQGANVLAVVVHYQGIDSFQYIGGRAGLIYALHGAQGVIASGEEALCRRSPTYVSGDMPLSTVQLGFTFEYDARGADDWNRIGYDVARKEWRRPVASFAPGEDLPELYLRPIRKPVIGERAPSRLRTQGTFARRAEPPGAIVAETMQNDYLSFRPARQLLAEGAGMPLYGGNRIVLQAGNIPEDGGVYLVLDMGREECGFLELELEADAGVRIDIAYGEHLDDLRVRASTRGKHFATRYTCGEGAQTFFHPLKRWAGRYLQLQIGGVQTVFTLAYAGLRVVQYPVERKGRLNVPDRLHRRIEEVAVRTLHLCMYEHYEDTPWREQALYAMDARNQALCGYYCFGEYEFPAAAARLFAESVRPDGFLELTAPSRSAFTIPSFTFLWLLQVEDYWMHSGDAAGTAEPLSVALRMMDAHLDNCRDGMLVTPTGDAYWNFYDWQPGLNGAGTKEEKERARNRADAPLNGMFLLALQAGGRLASAFGDMKRTNRFREAEETLRTSMHASFWDEEAQAYLTYRGVGSDAHFAELTQSLALCAGVCPEPLARSLRRRLAEDDNGFAPVTLSYSLFKFQALLGEPDLYGAAVFDTIAEQWGNMLFNGATSFWETLDGADAFGQAGSLCHGWSAIPVYFYYAYGLGVRPTEPGFRSFRVEPAQAGFERMEGKVPTPYGDIAVKWETCGEGRTIQIDYPAGTRPERNEAIVRACEIGSPAKP
ncbi:family 78 glycoside hydrolase catalytic domain [Paenibacillus hodogayensis]|uniref:Family 78 glycoside hydrolase catalytic domain n=1 Tax=Paenibacillus hodogayensis TaxID=279208 RepID=A0ABV5W4Q2_9BACL